MASPNLLGDFPAVGTETWEEAIRKDLNGADYARKLVWRTDEGLVGKPYYRSEDTASLNHAHAAPGSFPYVRGISAHGAWRIREEVDAVELKDAIRLAGKALRAGAEEIAFRNLALRNSSELTALFADLKDIPVHFLQADESRIRLLLQEPRPNAVSTDWDPLANLEFAAQVIQGNSANAVTFTIHGDGFEESGATAVQEIAFTLASAVDYLAEMQSRRVDIHRAATAIRFCIAIGSDYFFQIAKLRAFRWLFARVVESFGGAGESSRAHIDARTSAWNKTVYDPYVNVLRGTTEAMSAALGGADSISVAPFDECYQSPVEASRRLARNTQILLKKEAFLSRVSDPGGGSYYLEVLTDFLAREGWKTMQGLEAVGGYRKASAEGTIARALEASLALKEKAVRFRRRVFTGTNKYADPADTALPRIDISRFRSVKRGAEVYEQVRLRTERHVIRGGRCPRVLLAEMGDPKMRTIRSDFAFNLFACGGFDVFARPFETADEVAASPADMIVLCSSDAEYPALASAVVSKQLDLGQETPVMIAGSPDSVEQLRASGIAGFIHSKSDPVDILTRWQQHFGIRE